MSSFFNLEMDTGGTENYAAQLGSLSKLFSSNDRAWGSTLADIGDYFTERIQEEFDTEGRSSGGWKQLSPDYSSWKEERYGSLPILYLGGAYEKSFAWHDLPGGSIIIMSSEEATKQRWHTFGTPNMPARPPFFITTADLQAVDEMFAEGFDAVFFRRL